MGILSLKQREPAIRLYSQPDRLGVTMPNLNDPNAPKEEETPAESTGGGSGGGKKKEEHSSSSSSSTPKYSNEELIADYLALFYENYKPEQLVYDERTAGEISAEISAWLRPAYEAAIATRERQTDTYRAELDADAIARGMGASTYVTDVKSRQMQKEAGDILLLETDYAAQLASRMSDALAVERERSYETDRFNAEAQQEAYKKAYDMALAMLEAYRAGDRAARQLTEAMYAEK